MRQLKLKAPAKINWFLRITGLRENGYHELSMLMQTVDLFDELTISEAGSDSLIVDGVCSPEPEKNLIMRALSSLNRYTNKSLHARFELTKRIPARAGLGGGSSDCACALMGLNQLYDLNLTEEELSALALSLGADVPFFLQGGLCRVCGIGEKVQKLKFAPRAHLLIKHVEPGLSTPDVYRRYDEKHLSDPAFDEEAFLSDLKSGRFDKLTPHNALEAPAMDILSGITDTKQSMYDEGALYALMSGSGSAVYGVFPDEKSALKASERIPSSIFAHTIA